MRNKRWARGSRGSRRRTLPLVCFLQVLALLVLVSSRLFAQQAANPGPPADAEAGKTSSSAVSNAPESKQSSSPVHKSRANEPKKTDVQRSFVAAPLPISSPALGSGIVPVIGYIFPLSSSDKSSPPSVIGAAGLITDNGSQAFALLGQLYLRENTYQIRSVYARGNLNYDIYGDGIQSGLKLPLKQTGQAFLGEVVRRIGWDIFAGPRFLTGRSFITVRPTGGSSLPIPPEVGLHSNLTAIGIRVARDTRPNRFYPTSGTYFNFTSDFFSKTLGSKYSFQSYRTEFDKYWSLSSKQVIAYNADLCLTRGDPPFYGKCVYGTDDELRGYRAGQYFDLYMLTTQAEYRLSLPKRFGVVVFGGVGGVIPGKTIAPANSHFLPAGGAGLRFQLSKKYHVNLRADLAQGVTGHTFSMSVGEAF